VTSIGGTLAVSMNDALTSFAALASLRTLGGIDISGNRLLTNLTGLGGVREIADLKIVSNGRLADLGALALTSVDNVEIRSNPMLQNIEGLAGVTSVLDVLIEDDAALRNVEGLRGVTTARTITINNPITTLAGLRKLASINTLNLSSTRLTSLAGLGPVVFELAGVLNLDSNVQLTTLADLAKATARALRGVSITGNSVLQDLSGLESVAEIENFGIGMNQRLASLRGLENLMQLGNFDALNNPRLPACEVRALFARANGQMLYESGNNNAAICP